MSTKIDGGAAKSRKPAAKVGGEFGAVGGIVVVGGVLAAGIAAAAITCLRRRSRKMLHNPAENLSLEDKPTSENVEEVEPILEIANMEKLSVENFSPMDLELSANEKSINRSKGDESPRSHFSLSVSFGTSASASSDSEDLVEINQMSLKENEFEPLKETSASYDFGVGIESGKESVEYEESVDSFDGLEDREEVGGQKVNDCEESGQSSLVCIERYSAEKGVEFVSGYREGDKVCAEDDGSMHVEPIQGIDAADVSSCGGSIDVKLVKGDFCVDREEKDEMGTDGKEETALFNQEDLQEKVGGNEGLNCDRENCWQSVIDRDEGLTSVKEDYSDDVRGREGDPNVDFGHCDERAEHGEVDMSEECLGPIREQSQREIVRTNQGVLFYREESLQEKLESNEWRCGEENIDIEESDNHMVNDGSKEEQCGTVVSRDFEDLDYEGGVSHCEEKCQHGEREFSEETSCPTGEEIQQESVKSKELESTEVDDYCCQDAAPHEVCNTKEKDRLCKEEHPEQKTFESNVEQCLPERPISEEKSEEREIDLAHECEQCQHGTVGSKGFEVLEYEGDSSHSDERGKQEEEFLEHNCSPINETTQSKELECVETEVHDLPWEERSVLEENLDSKVKQCPQEKTDTEDDLKGCHVDDTAHKGEQCQQGTVDFGGLEGLDYKGGSNNCDEVGQHGELEDAEENLFPINEQSRQETLHKFDPDSANTEENFVLNFEQCSQEKTDCIAALPNKDEQCQTGTVDSTNFGGLNEDASLENGSCQHGAVGPRELDDLSGDSHSEKGQFENERLNSKEDIQNEQFENGSLDSKEYIENEKFENGMLNSKQVVQLDTGVEEKLSLQEENINEPQEASEVSVMEMEFEENAVHLKDLGVDEDAHIFKEQPQEEAMDSNESQNVVEDIIVNHELCKGTTCESEESEFVEENMPIAQEEYKQEIANSVDREDAVECIPVTTLQCHREINESDELEGVAIAGKKHQGDALYLEQLELSDNLHSHDEPCGQEERLGEESPPSQKEIVALKEANDLECLNQCKESHKQLPIELKVEADCIAPVVHEGEQCQLGIVDSRNFGGLDEDALHENGSCQYGAVGPRELDDLNRDSHSEKGHFENERLNSKEDIQNEQFENGSLKSKEDIGNEQFETGRLNSKEVVRVDIGLEEKLSLQEENIKEPLEALEVSVMEMECEENAVNSQETGVDGDAHIFKEENPQEEAMDSNESKNFVEDIIVNHELCKGATCESEESKFVEDNMSIAQEAYKQEIVNSVDIQDSVECIPITTLQCHREMNESDKLESVAIPGEKYQGDAVYLEQLELSDNLHSHNEPCKQEERLGEQSPPSQKEIVAFKETNDLEYLNECKQSQEKEIDSKDLGYSSSIDLESSLNDTDCAEAYESSHEDPQTYIKAEVNGTKDSEYSYGYTTEKEKNQLETVDQVEKEKYQIETVDPVGKEKQQLETVDQVEKEKYLLEIVDQAGKEKKQPETVDQVEKEKYQLETVVQIAGNYYSEDQELCPEQEEVEENSSTRTHNLNDQDEANQDISTMPTPENCKLLGFLKQFKLDDESTDSKSVTPLESEPREVSNTNSITERENKGWDPLHSSQLVPNSGEGKFLWMKPQRPLYMRTRITVSLFVALLAFFFAYKLANMLETVYAT